jgi:hypothetical protein
MRPMKYRPNTRYRDAYPAPSTLADLGPSGPQQGLNLVPSDVRGGRLGKDPT